MKGSGDRHLDGTKDGGLLELDGGWLMTEERMEAFLLQPPLSAWYHI